MAEFETACQNRHISFYVLPPRSPKINGAVERANGAWRYEFYVCYNLPYQLDALSQLIDSFSHLYNT